MVRHNIIFIWPSIPYQSPTSFQLFGLSLDKTMTDAMNPYLDSHQDRCILEEEAASQRHGPIMFFKMVPAENVTKISCSRDWKSLHIYKNRSEVPITSHMGRGLEKVSDSSLFQNRNKRAAVPQVKEEEGTGGCGQMTLPLTYTVKDGVYSYSFSVSGWESFLQLPEITLIMSLSSSWCSSLPRRRRVCTTCTSTVAPITTTTLWWHSTSMWRLRRIITGTTYPLERCHYLRCTSCWLYSSYCPESSGSLS